MTEIQSVRESPTMAISEITVGKRPRLGVDEVRMGVLPQRDLVKLRGCNLACRCTPGELANR